MRSRGRRTPNIVEMARRGNAKFRILQRVRKESLG